MSTPSKTNMTMETQVKMYFPINTLGFQRPKVRKYLDPLKPTPKKTFSAIWKNRDTNDFPASYVIVYLEDHPS